MAETAASETPAPSMMVSMDVLRKLVPAAEELGISLPGVSRFAPSIDVTMPIRQLALEIGRLVSREHSEPGTEHQNIFIKASGAVVTLDDQTGEEKLMTSRRFPDWAEQFCEFRAPGSRRVRDSLSVDDAAQILETDTFLACLRPLNGVHMMRLPVRRPPQNGNGEFGTVEFLAPGYDAKSCIFTAGVSDTTGKGIVYEMDWSIERALAFLEDVCFEIPWNVAAVDQPLRENRSFAVHVLAMVATYCHALFPPGTLRPMLAYFANKPASGKTRLVEMALSHVWGFIASTGAPKDEEKMEVKLETIAQSMQPWAIFDDIGGSLRSNALNRFLTAPMHGGRRFHSNDQFFKVPNVTQVFVTANDLPTSDDLDRRALIVELFLDVEARGRVFKRVITPEWLAMRETRAQFLSACCALVKHWLANGDGEMVLHSSPLETFEEFTSVMGGVVVTAGLADPLGPREGVVGGSSQEDEIKALLLAVATSKDEDCIIPRQELVDIARELELLADLVGSEGEEAPDAALTKRFGRRMGKWRGQKLKDARGRLFVFGHKKKKTGVNYPLTFLSQPTVGSEPTAQPAPDSDIDELLS